MAELPRVERPNMTGYGVPEDLDGTLPWSWAEERLVATKNYWVVTVDPQNRPHSMPVWGAWIADAQHFVFSCDGASFKARNLRQNPHVVVTCDDTVEVVSVEGVATEGVVEADTAKLFGEKYGPYLEADGATDMNLDEFLLGSLMFTVAPTKAFGLIERAEEFANAATRWNWSA